MNRYSFPIVQIILTSLLLSGCEIKSDKTKFIERFHLSEHQKMYVISMYSCGGCIEEKIIDHLSDQDIVIFDTTSISSYSSVLKRRRHFHISNDMLERTFGRFSNAILITRSKSGYIEERIDN